MHGEPENFKASVSLLEPLAQVVLQFRARSNIAMDVRHVVVRRPKQFQRRPHAHGGAQAEPFGLQAEDTFAIDEHEGIVTRDQKSRRRNSQTHPLSITASNIKLVPMVQSAPLRDSASS